MVEHPTTYTREQVQSSLREAIVPLQEAVVRLGVQVDNLERVLFDELDLRRWGAVEEEGEVQSCQG